MINKIFYLLLLCGYTVLADTLTGDVIGPNDANVVNYVGGQTAANIATATISINAATENATANAIVKRDSVGRISATTVNANLNGNVLGNVVGNLTGNVLGNVLGNTIGNVLGNLTGEATLTNLTTAGVVHNNSAGVLSTSQIVNSDIIDGTITDAKLATISSVGKVANSATTATSANTQNSIVSRDVNGNFAATTVNASLVGSVTGNLTGNVQGNVVGSSSLNVLKSGDTMTGSLTVPTLQATSAVVTGLNSVGIVHTDAQGNLSTSPIVNSDVSNSAALADSKLATITTAGKVANSATTATSTNTANTIVSRDVNGSFSAITVNANLVGNVQGNVTGSASLNVLKSGDTMTGTLTVPQGSTSAPSISFTESVDTGFSASSSVLSLNAGGSQSMTVSNSAITAATKLLLTNLLCNQALQVSTNPMSGSTITANATTSVLLIKPAANISLTIVLPSSPTNGQLFSILNGTTSGYRLTFTYVATPASVINEITYLDTTALNGSNGGVSVTYIYYSVDNAWYRFSRG